MDQRDIDKHKKDVYRLAYVFDGSERFEVNETINAQGGVTAISSHQNIEFHESNEYLHAWKSLQKLNIEPHESNESNE